MKVLVLGAGAVGTVSALKFAKEAVLEQLVIADTVSANPPCNAACRAGFCPSPAGNTQPIRHSSTFAGAIPARLTASRTAIAPS